MEGAARAAETEAIFRDVNETIVEQQPADGAVTTLLCECSSDTCAESVIVPRDDYERVRTVATRFFVRPQHVTPQIEVVVERLPGYWVIEKHGEAAEIAEETDPRS